MFSIKRLDDKVVNSALSFKQKRTKLVLKYKDIAKDLDLCLIDSHDWAIKLKGNTLHLYPIINGIVIVKGKVYYVFKKKGNWYAKSFISNLYFVSRSRLLYITLL